MWARGSLYADVLGGKNAECLLLWGRSVDMVRALACSSVRKSSNREYQMSVSKIKSEVKIDIVDSIAETSPASA